MLWSRCILLDDDGQRQHLEAAASKWFSGCTEEWKVCLEYIFHIITPARVSCSCRLSLLAVGAGSAVFCCCSRSAGAQGPYNERATVSQLQVSPASAPLSLQRREEIRLLCLRMALNIEFLLSRIQFSLLIRSSKMAQNSWRFPWDKGIGYLSQARDENKEWTEL